MEQYAIYLRKSRADIELELKGELETLSRHRKLLLDTAQKLNLSVTKIYKEIVSGETISARPVVQTLLEEVEQGIWAGVLVVEIERLARGDTIDQGIIARAFKYHNTKIITPLKTYDPSNEFDEEYFEFGLFMSRREYRTINRRIQRGRIASAKEGKFIGSVPPLGYDKIRISGEKGFMLKPNADADTVKFIFDNYSSGIGMTAISKKLDRLGIRPKSGLYWNKSTVNDILKNPVYIGKIRWSYEKEIKSPDGTHRKKSDEYILANGRHEPIISEKIFAKVQNMMKINRKSPVKADFELKNPFMGLIYCKKCGAVMTRLGKNSKNKYDVIKCPNRYCDNVSAPIFLVEKKLLTILSQWLADYKIEVGNSQIQNQNFTIIERLQNELIKVNNQIENTYNLLEQGVYPTDVFISRNKILTDRKNEILKAINEEDSQSQLTEYTIIPQVESIVFFYNTLKLAKYKNLLLRQALEKIEYIKLLPNRKGQLLNDNFDIYIYPKLPKNYF